MIHGDIGPWELTPKWHWRYWLGYDVRRWIVDYNFHIGDDHWEYGPSKRVAREMLQRAYAPTEHKKQDGGREYDWFLDSSYPPQH